MIAVVFSTMVFVKRVVLAAQKNKVGKAMFFHIKTSPMNTCALQQSETPARVALVIND